MHSTAVDFSIIATLVHYFYSVRCSLPNYTAVLELLITQADETKAVTVELESQNLQDR
jgi:hypothetical protein